MRVAAGGGGNLGDRYPVVAAKDGVVLVVLGDHVGDHVDEPLASACVSGLGAIWLVQRLV